MVLNGPSWFVATLWFFYWCFPSLLPKLQEYSIEEKLIGIRRHFWIQAVVGYVIYLAFSLSIGLYAFFPATF